MFEWEPLLPSCDRMASLVIRGPLQSLTIRLYTHIMLASHMCPLARFMQGALSKGGLQGLRGWVFIKCQTNNGDTMVAMAGAWP